jgi:hypothetical protein
MRPAPLRSTLARQSAASPQILPLEATEGSSRGPERDTTPAPQCTSGGSEMAPLETPPSSPITASVFSPAPIHAGVYGAPAIVSTAASAIIALLQKETERGNW